MLIKKLKFNWLKLFSVALFFLLIGSYTHIFAIGQPYNPGETLDPACSPEEVNCTVLITGGSSVWTTNGNDIYYNTGNVGIGLISPNNLFQVEDLINFDNTDYNTKLGYQAGKNIISGSQANTFVGYESGFSGIGNSNADYNTAIGNSTLYSNTAGYNNAAIGSYSLYYNTTGYLNSAVGALSLVSNTTGINNTAMGADAMYYNTSGYGNSSYGVGSLMYNVGNHRSTAIGLDAMLYADNRSVGRETFNTALGYEALRGTTTAANNTGQYNTAIGDSALLSNSSGYNNSAVGYGSLYSNTTGYYNTALGYQSGRYISDGLTVNDTSDFGVYLGHNTKAGANNNQNEIVIGYDAIGNGSNTATIGNTSLLRTYLTGVNLKAGTATTGTAPLKLTAGTNLTTAETGAMEYDGTNLYFTPSGTTRRTIAYTDSNITGTAGGLSSTLGVTSGGTGLATVAAGSVLGYNTLDTATAITSTSGTRVLTNTNGTITWETASGGMVYPGAGIPNSTGSAWGTSYTTTGSGTVLALATSPSFTTPSLGVATATSINNLPLSQDNTDFNVKVGQDAGLNLVTGSQYNTLLGYEAGNSSNSSGSDANTSLGYRSGYSLTSGARNTSVGYRSLYGSTGGTDNTAMGYDSLYTGNYGSENSSYGAYSLRQNTDGERNVAIGFNSLYLNGNGSQNTAVGSYSLYSLNNANYNTGIGNQAGRYLADGTSANSTSDYSLYLGPLTKSYSGNSQNEIVIGYNAIGNGSNTATIGNTSLLRTYLTGVNLKAGTATAGTAPLKLTAGTNLSTTEAGAIEYDGTHLYFTATNGGTRYQLDQQSSGGMVYPGAGIANSTGSAWGTSYTTTGSGTVLALATTPTFTTNITTPLIIGGTTTTSPLTLRSTSGVGTTGADIVFQTGNNGATEAMRILNNGRVGIGTDAPNSLFQVAGLISFDTAEYNTEIGQETGLNLVAGAQYNTFLGHQAGRGGNTGGTDTADYNTAIGYRAFYANTTGGSNTAIGNYALTSNTTGDSNSAIGTRALFSNTGGYNNTANGMYALYSNLTGNYNNANGQYSLFSNTTGGYNTAFGNYSLNANVAGSNATAFGYNAMQYSNSTDIPFINYNIAIGYEALRGTTTAANNTGNYNTAIGYQSSFGYETAARNTTIGYFAGRNNVSGNNNLLLGYQAGDALTSGSTNIALGYDVDLPSATADNQMTIGNLIFASGGFGTGTTIGTGNVGIANNSPSYRLHVGNSSVAGIVARFENGTGTCDINPTTASLVCSSDINLKKNITTLDDMEFTLETLSDLSEKSILEKLGYLTPVLYNWNNEEDGSSKHIGFIAQEVEQVFPEVVSTDINNNQKSIAYTNLIPYTIQAIQEMDLKVKDLDQKINNLSVPILMKEFFGGVLVRITDGVGYLKNIVVENIKVGSPEKRTGITLYDEETGEPYCLSISGGQTKTKIGECGVVTPSPEIIIEKEEIEITEIEDDIEIISNEILVEEIKEAEQKELNEIDENIIEQNEYIDEETNPQNIPQTDNKEEEQDPIIVVDN